MALSNLLSPGWAERRRSATTILEKGPLAALAPGLAQHLVEQGYTLDTVARHVRLLAHLDHWLREQDLAPDQLTAMVLNRFLQWRRGEGCARRSSRRGIAPLLDYLRKRNVVPTWVEVAERSAAERVLALYQRHLIVERGLVGTTVRHYQHYARLFFSQLSEPLRADPSRLSAATVTAVVRSQCRSHSVGWAKNFNTVLRSLLRFMFLERHIPCDLSPCVLPAAGWRQSGLAKALDPQDVARLLANCDPKRRAGRRDRAILMLMARLGLRAGEVAAIELEDFDWRAGTVLIRGKGGRQDRLPLPTDVGEVVVDYLRHGRPTTVSRRVFILAVCPRVGISAETVAGVVRCACARAGLPSIGPHRLRHTVATEMLRGGAPLAEVGQVLRHASTATTAIYAKVDLTSLVTLALPWPEVRA